MIVDKATVAFRISPTENIKQRTHASENTQARIP
jgi:hypothetical protein